MCSRTLIGIGLALGLLGSYPATAQGTAEKTCKRPELREQANVSAEQMNYLTESAQAYIECMKPVIEAKRSQAQEMLKAAKGQAEAANTAVTEVNGFVESFRAYQTKHKDDE